MRGVAAPRMLIIVIKRPRSEPGSGKLAVAVRSKSSASAWVIFQSAHWVNFRSALTYEVQKILGHTQVKTTQRYAHLAQETLLDATNAVAGILGDAMPVVKPVTPMLPAT